MLNDQVHQAVEAKEGVTIQTENQTLASITFQNYFRLYEHLAGMTGTAVTSAEEFEKVYKLTPIIAGYGKELRILTSYGENVPVKVVVFEKEKEGKRLYDLICVQDQRVGTIEN